jgi:Na+/H+-translocating membrane pyrophosphatase
LAVGFGLGRRVVAGYLIGLIVSGIQFSLSGIISAQVWKNAKKMIESGSVSDEGGKVIARGTDCHKASLIGR